MTRMIHAAMTVDKPDEVEATLSMTMKLADWKLLSRQLGATAWPAWELGVLIRNLVEKADQRFTDMTDDGGRNA